MSVRGRNVAVGLTVMAGLAMLGVLSLLFSGLPSWTRGGYDLSVALDNAGGLRNGDAVNLNGKAVGKVTSIEFSDGDPAKGLMIHARLDSDQKIPADVKAVVVPPAVGMGTSVLNFVAPMTGQASKEFLPTDGTAVVQGSTVPGMTEMMQKASVLLDQIGVTLTAINTGAGPGGTTLPADSPIALLTGSLKKMSAALDATLAVVGDKDNQQNIKLTLANLRTFTTQGVAAMGEVKGLLAQASGVMTDITKATSKASNNVDQLTQNLIRNTEDVSRTMATLNAALTKMERGDGTAGKLLNDPKLYNNLVDITEQMTSIMKDLQLLVKEWKDRGVGIKLK